MWECESCGTQGIAGDLQRCPGCGVARTAGVDGVQVPADAELAAALAPVIPAGAGVDVEATPPATPTTPEPLATPDTATAHQDTAATETAPPSIPDGTVPDGT